MFVKCVPFFSYTKLNNFIVYHKYKRASYIIIRTWPTYLQCGIVLHFFCDTQKDCFIPHRKEVINRYAHHHFGDELPCIINKLTNKII